MTMLSDKDIETSCGGHFAFFDRSTVTNEMIHWPLSLQSGFPTLASNDEAPVWKFGVLSVCHASAHLTGAFEESLSL